MTLAVIEEKKILKPSSAENDNSRKTTTKDPFEIDYRDPDFKTATMSRWPTWIGKKCVKVKRTEDDVQVQDSKLENSPTLIFTHDEWRAFIHGVKNGEFDLSEVELELTAG